MGVVVLLETLADLVGIECSLGVTCLPELNRDKEKNSEDGQAEDDDDDKDLDEGEGFPMISYTSSVSNLGGRFKTPDCLIYFFYVNNTPLPVRCNL